jgi:hypothetical protein
MGDACNPQHMLLKEKLDLLAEPKTFSRNSFMMVTFSSPNAFQASIDSMVASSLDPVFTSR